MTYSIDLRVRVIEFVRDGGRKSDAEKLFSVTRRTIYNWLNSKDISPKKHGERNRKIDKKSLILDVKKHSDKTLQERVNQFSVVNSAIHKALKKLKFHIKKDFRYQEKCHEKRINVKRYEYKSLN